jgi:uncharacterized protein (TIGR02145 family)
MKTRIKNCSISKLAIFSGSLLAAASAIYLYSPVIKTNATEERAVDVTVNVNPIVSLSLDKSALNFNITPTSAGVFDSGSIVATVDTNSTGGYELYFSSEDSGTALTSLVSESTIASDFNSAVTSSTMSANKWGYSLDATNFNKIPALADQAKIKDLDHVPTSAEKDTTVTIGTKIDSSLPSGTYSKKVVFSAIAHPSEMATLHSITTMQQMTSAICTETTTPLASATRFDWDGTHHGDNTYVPRVKLQDTRDNNYYLVSKLADGNCWMSQNLALDLNVNTELTAVNTDLNTKNSWTPEHTTLTEKVHTWGYEVWSEEVAAEINRAAYSYHPIVSDSFFQAGLNMSSSPTENTDEYLWESAGNVYNWYASTAGSGTIELMSVSVADSICPRGWQLPELSGDKSYYKLITETYDVDATGAISAPLNFLKAGMYNVWHGDDKPEQAMDHQGVNGNYAINYASSTEANQRYTFVIGSATGVYPQRDRTPKGVGISMRCVAR